MWYLLLLSSAQATEIGARPFGIGLQLGAPSALTGKIYTRGREQALDFAVGAYYDGGPFYNGLYVQSSYHFTVEVLTSGNGVTVPFRIGIGGFVGTWDYGWREWDSVVVGARVPFGLDFDLESIPLQLYIELAPTLSVLPPLRVAADGGLGFRYYF